MYEAALRVVMSALGHKQTFAVAKHDVRFTPNSGHDQNKLCAAVFSTRSLPSKKSVVSKSRLLSVRLRKTT